MIQKLLGQGMLPAKRYMEEFSFLGPMGAGVTLDHAIPTAVVGADFSGNLRSEPYRFVEVEKIILTGVPWDIVYPDDMVFIQLFFKPEKKMTPVEGATMSRFSELAVRAGINGYNGFKAEIPINALLSIDDINKFIFSAVRYVCSPQRIASGVTTDVDLYCTLVGTYIDL